jgi:hypothetical protein
VAHHLGVLPALAVGILKQRQHKHILQITFHQGDAPAQIAVFEVSKQAPRTLLPILNARIHRPTRVHTVPACCGSATH